MPLSAYVYMLASAPNGTLYTGVTTNPARRIRDHRAGCGSKFVARYGVYRLVWYERHARIVDAIAQEKELKNGTRAQKLELIQSVNPTWRDVYDEICLDASRPM